MIPSSKQRKLTRTCAHANTTMVCTGGLHHSAGEVWDDFHEELFCLDCKKIVRGPRSKPKVLTDRRGNFRGFRDMVTRHYVSGGEFQPIEF